LLTVRATEMERIDDQLKVLGAAQPGEAQSLTEQRDALTRKKNSLLEDEQHAKQLSQTSRELAAQIVNLRRNLFNSQVTSRTDSPFSPTFWSTLIRPTAEDLQRLDNLKAEGIVALKSAISPEHPLGVLQHAVGGGTDLEFRPATARASAYLGDDPLAAGGAPAAQHVGGGGRLIVDPDDHGGRLADALGPGKQCGPE
jgi:hypothetical protein